MLHIINGDLLASDATMIIHQANCFNVMGGGIARQIKRRYPQVFHEDRNHSIPVGDINRLGTYSSVSYLNKIIINAYGQHGYGGDKVYTQTDKLIQAIRQAVQENPNYTTKVGLPYQIGCGLAGGNWEEVFQELSMLSQELQVDFYLYKI